MSFVESSTQLYARDTNARSYARHRLGQPYVVDILRQLARNSPGKAVLEMGCGTGAYAASLAADNALEIFGMDLSLQMLRRAVVDERVTYVQGRATELPFADAAMGMVYSVNVIHHLRALDGYFREAARVLGHGGVLCTATDSSAIIERRVPLSHYWPETVPAELERYHDVGRLRARMEAAGFRDVAQCEGRAEFSITDDEAYREKAFSCLRLIPEDAFKRGLSAMQADLRLGPVKGASELIFIWGVRF